LGDENRLDPEIVAQSIRSLGRDARVFGSSQEIADTLSAESEPGDILMVMSNGSFDGLCEKLIKKLGDEARVPTEATSR
jgi:UDP-N-acetylmuramate: L-alanyl-gamma-D-glutamyl-meso-diaminopimelate ligase